MRNFVSVKSRLKEQFLSAVQKNAFPEFVKQTKVLLASWNSNDSKGVMELMIREVLLELKGKKADIMILERVFQFTIDIALHDYVAGNAPVLIIGDVFESSTISECEIYFSFMESRVETFKKEIFFKACKTQMLRSCNDLLKRLSRSQNTVFCGRILMFLAHLFPLSERSGLNIISEFNLENTTSYNLDDDAFADLGSEKEDTEEEGEISSKTQSSIVVDKSLYQKFWSLQDFFRSPNTCYNKMQWRQFASYTSDILTVFGSFKSDAASSKWKQVKLPASSGAHVYFAKYLTSPRLLELELGDSHFRRYVLIQFLIVFQYLTSTVKFKLESYSLTEEQQNFIKETTANIYRLLAETPPNGEVFASDVEKILQREEYWNAWKNEGCPDFKQITEKVDIEKRLKKRPAEELRTYGNKKSNSDITKIWNAKPNNWEACRSAKRNFVPSLESFFGITGKDDAGHCSQKRDLSDSKYTWKALRLLCMKSPHVFTANTAQVKGVFECLDTIIQKVAKEKPQAQQDIVMTVETADAEDETMEDGNDEFFPASEEDSKEEVKKENVLTKTLIQTISEKLQDKWKPLAVKLGFQEDEIEYYETFPSRKVQVEQMLTVWMERDGSLPTFTKVLESENMLKDVLTLIV